MKYSCQHQVDSEFTSRHRSHLKLISSNSNSSGHSITSAAQDNVDGKFNTLGRESNNFQKEQLDVKEEQRINRLKTRRKLNWVHHVFEKNQFLEEKNTTNSYSKNQTYKAWKHRTGYCHRRQFDSSQPTSFYGDGKIDNLFHCKTAQCVACAGGYFCKKHNEIQKVLNHYEQLGNEFYLFTLTVRHSSKDSLADVNELASSCKTKLMKHKAFKDLHSIGWVARKEETVGRNGWHVHYHIIGVFDERLMDRMIEDTKRQWVKICHKAGNFVTYENGLDVKHLSGGAKEATAYICKNDDVVNSGGTLEGGTEGKCSTEFHNTKIKQAALEIASVNTKKGRKESYCIDELISLAAEDKWSEIFFTEFKTEQLVLEYYSLKNKKTFQYSKNFKRCLDSLSGDDSDVSGGEVNEEEGKKRIDVDSVVVYRMIEHKIWNKILLCNVRQTDVNDILAEMWRIIERSGFEEKYGYVGGKDKSITNFVRLVDTQKILDFKFSQTLFTKGGERLLAA